MDVFSFSAAAGAATLQVVGAPAWGTVLRSDLYLQLWLQDAAGVVIATAAGVGVGPLRVTLPSSGMYYVSIIPQGAGDPSSAYSSYGSRGQYQLTISYQAAP